MNHPVAETQRSLESWLGGVPLPPPPDAAALLPGSTDMATAELVFSLLAWESGVPAAVSAARRLADQFVDLNEVRVALEEEVEDTVGMTDEHAIRRARAILDTLNAVFDREDAVSIDRVARAGAHEGGPYLEGIEALPAFAVERVLLLAFGEHRVPVDGRLLGVLVERGVVPAETSTADAADLLARCCSTGEARDLYLRLEAAAGRVARV